MPTENEHENIETTDSTSDELLKLKKGLAKEIVHKLQKKDSSLFSSMLEGSITDYLVDENTFSDAIHDELLGGLGKSAGLITPELKRYREMLSQAKTKDDLENLKTTIFNEIGQDSPSSESSATGTSSSTTSTTESSGGTAASAGSDEKAKVDTTSESYEIDHLNFTISNETKEIYNNLKGKEKPDLEPFACALKVYNTLKKQGKIKNTKYLTVVDFTKKKGKKRFFVINMENNTVEHAVKVGHGKNTGSDRAKQFSNRAGSNQSSLGGYLLPDTITKSPNKSRSGLRQITGLESSNNKAAQRGIAVHPGGENGSEGCFTLPKDISRKIMEEIKGGFLFAYAESREYFAQSNYFSQNSDGSIMA